ncbi:MAG TPA: SpaA isopeptide-forming pilin-related protein [Amycolatopsis sp.]|uniref:SpaA isopeptide-forming pilin-related protein n=1 Tax=Amycolatopsis sp. TaxID=37632 RepID=UPI002F420585
MNKSRGARSVARTFATLAAAAALTSVFATPAGAEEPTSTAPSTVEAPSSSSTTPTSSAPESKPAAQPQAEPVERAQVEISAVFDKETYQTDEDVHFTFKVTNVGSATAKGLWVSQRFDQPTDLNVPYEPGWGPLTSGNPGVDLEPGKTFVLHGTGKIRDIDQDSTVLRGVVFDATNFGVGEFTAKAAVAKVAGRATGVVYGDKNGDATLDDGEQLAGAKLTLRYVHGDKTYTATSDADGKFTFADLPAAEYYLGGEVVNGWLIPWQTIRIGPDSKDLLVRGAPPLNGALKATMAFTQDSYKVGDLAHVTVTLSNSGKTPLVGIVAACNRIGDPHHLTGRTPGWGDLATTGVTIAPGETRTFDVTEAVPEAAFNRGYVVVSCDFGYDEVDIENHADAGDQAWVPGAKATIIGRVVHGEQGLAGVKAVLVSDQKCPVVGEQTTDASGTFEFHDVVPGPNYDIYLLPPSGWRIKYDNPTSPDVRGPADQPARLFIEAEEGDAPLPTVPANPADCTPGAPTSTTGAAGGTGGGQSSGSGLASTGVEALGLGALALTALALGGGLVFTARRRKRAA